MNDSYSSRAHSRARVAASSPLIAVAAAPATALALMALLLLAALASGCAGVPKTRVLADHIRTVYVPMFKNDSPEPDVEEDLTRSVQEAFLEDGRLQVGREKEADIVLEGKLIAYKARPRNFEGDDFPWQSEITVEATVTAYDPYDYDREFPLGTWDKIRATRRYESDTRRVTRLTDVDNKKLALRQLAQAIMSSVLFKAPSDIEMIQKKNAEERANLRAREAQIRFRSAYKP